LIATPGFYLTPRFPSDGQRLALAQIAAAKYGIFVNGLQREQMSPLTFDTPEATYPIGSPDGRHIVFRFFSEVSFGGWIRADGAGEILRAGSQNKRATTLILSRWPAAGVLRV
jgi:hypothetical protein